MAQGYYTLEEAARLLGISEDELKIIARKGDIRSFQDRGTWRFRVHDIEELARQRGLGSDPDLELGDSAFREATSDEIAVVGEEDLTGSSSGRRQGRSASTTEAKTMPGSDSDIRLVDDMGDSDRSDSAVDLGATPAGTGGSSQSKKRGDSLAGAQQPDSGVRLVPMDSDPELTANLGDSDDVPLGAQPPMTLSDSDIRLETEGRKEGDSGILTDEIDLDKETRLYEQRHAGGKSDSKLKLGDQPAPSPFELQSDVHLPAAESSEEAKGKSPADSSDFELTPAKDADSPLEVDSDEYKRFREGGGKDDDEPSSGVSLRPDSQESDEFELSMEQEAAESSEVESSSEFELTLSTDDSSDEMAALGEETSSEFELTLDSGRRVTEEEVAEDSSEFELAIDSGEGPQPGLSSDSEFELQLDDLEEASSSSEFELTIDDDLQAVGDSGVRGADNLLETELDISNLDDESGSEVVALEGDDLLESSDIDIDIGEDDLIVEEESSSQVVTIDEDEVDEAAETVSEKASRRMRGGELLEEGFDDLYEEDIEVEDEEEDEEALVGAAPAAQAAPWGISSLLLLFPCALIMLILALMTFEMAQGIAGYDQPGMVTNMLSSMFK